MPTIQLEAQVSAKDLLRAVGQLEAADLDEFVDQVLALRAGRLAPSLSRDEGELFRRINEGLPEAVHARYQALTARRKAQDLTPEEHQELLGLIDQAELAEASRAQALVELARLRGKPLAALIEDLGIRPPSDD
jgi:hypothetical protein